MLTEIPHQHAAGRDPNPDVPTDACPPRSRGDSAGTGPRDAALSTDEPQSLQGRSQHPRGQRRTQGAGLFLALLTALKSSLKRNLLITFFFFYCVFSSLLFHALAKNENYF